MSEEIDGSIADLLAQPLAGHIADLSDFRRDALTEAQKQALLHDIFRLEGSARGHLLQRQEAHEALEIFAQIREHLDAAETAASALPGFLLESTESVEPSGQPIASLVRDLKILLERKLHRGEQFASSSASKMPKRRGPPPDQRGRLVALMAARIYWRRTGKFPTKGKNVEGITTSKYFEFLDCVLSGFGIGKDFETWGGLAVDQLKAEHAKSVMK